jgi:hypothetical protein
MLIKSRQLLSSSQEGPDTLDHLKTSWGRRWTSYQEAYMSEYARCEKPCFNKPARWFPSFPSELGAMSWTMSGGGYQANS